MKRLAISLAIFAAAAGSAVAADSPFDGTWTLNVAKSQFTGDTLSYTKTPKGYRYSNGSTITYDFAIDGKDYPVVADRTTAWTQAGPDAWDTVFKANGVVLSKAHRTLSADGKQLTSIITNERPDGTTVQETDVDERVSGGPGLAGEWKNVKAQVATDTQIITTPAPGKFVISYPAFKQTVSGATDGSSAEMKGPNLPAGLTTSYKATAPDRWEYSVSFNGKVYNQGVLTVSADGKTLTDKSWTPGKEAEASVAVYDKP